MPPKSSSRSNDRSEHGDEAEEFKLPENKLLQRAVSIHGLLEIIQILSCLTAFVCSVLDTTWLTQSGGGFASFTTICCVIFTIFFFIMHSYADWDANPKWGLSEWLGYLLATALLMASAAVTIKACGVSYTRTSADGRKVLLQIAHLEGTAVFLVLSCLLFVIKSFLHTRSRCCSKSSRK